MDALDMGENNAYKQSWQARAEILGKISNYYKNKIGVTNKAGDAEVSYADYWNDLMSLFDSDVAGQDNVITELRLYNEIVYQIYTRTVEFKNEAGISRQSMEQALDDITDKMSAMYLDNNRQAQELKNTIENNIDMARKNITATFSGSGENGTDTTTENDAEGGDE